MSAASRQYFYLSKYSNMQVLGVLYCLCSPPMQQIHVVCNTPLDLSSGVRSLSQCECAASCSQHIALYNPYFCTCDTHICWNVFVVQELCRSPYPVVRNNIMVALSDMLIQYTALVDAHMPRLAGCIR